MRHDAGQRMADLRLGLRACEQLRREVRRGGLASDDWTAAELEAMRDDLRAQVIAVGLGLDPRFVRPRA